MVSTEKPVPVTQEDEIQMNEMTIEADKASLSKTESPLTDEATSTPAHEESTGDHITSISTKDSISTATVSFLQSTSQPHMMVQFVTTFDLEPYSALADVTFEQARSEIAFTHHPYNDISEKTVLATTTPVLPNEETSQHFESSDVTPQTEVTTTSLEDKTVEAPSQAPLTKEVLTDTEESSDKDIDFTEAYGTQSPAVTNTVKSTETSVSLESGSTDSENQETQDSDLKITHQPTGVIHSAKISTSSDTEVVVTTIAAERISVESTSDVLVPSQPNVTVQFATTVSPVQDVITSQESFEQVKSEITLAYRPHTDLSSDEVSLTKTHPILASNETSQFTESTTLPAAASSVAETLLASAEDGTVEPTLDQISSADKTKPSPDKDVQTSSFPDDRLDDKLPTGYEANPLYLNTATLKGEAVLITTPPSVFLTSESKSVDPVSSTESSSKEEDTRSPVVAVPITVMPPVNAVSLFSSGSVSESASSSELSMTTASTVKMKGDEVENITSEPLSATTKFPSILSTGIESGSVTSKSVPGELMTRKTPNIDSMEEHSLSPDEIQTVFKVDSTTVSNVVSASVDGTSGKVVGKIQGAVSPHSEMFTRSHADLTTVSPAQAQSQSVLTESGATSLSSFLDDDLGSDTTVPPSLIGGEPPIKGEDTAARLDAGLDFGHTVDGETVEIPGMFLQKAFIEIQLNV